MNLRVWRVEISDWSGVSRPRQGEGRAQAAARRAWPLRAAAEPAWLHDQASSCLPLALAQTAVSLLL